MKILENIFPSQTATLQVIDLMVFYFCCLNGHFVETRIYTHFRAVKRRLSTKLSTYNVDI
jgi:hypothetical protein